MMGGSLALFSNRFVVSVIFSLVVLFSTLAPAGAITGGQPDNGAHPQVAFILAPEVAFCSGSLISPTVVLTAGHCTFFFSSEEVEEVLVSFDDQVTSQSTFFTSHEWYTHPGYVDADWPFTQDYGVLILDEAVDLPLATLPELGLLDTLIPARGAGHEVFTDVGYGQTGVITGGGPPQPNFPLERRQSSQKYHPGQNDMVGVIHGITDLLFMLKANPSSRHGSGCGGDSGGPIFWGDTYTIVAIHTGGYRLGVNEAICGRLSSLNHRIDTAAALDWLYQFV